jgi:hypothetical protein
MIAPERDDWTAWGETLGSGGLQYADLASTENAERPIFIRNSEASFGQAECEPVGGTKSDNGLGCLFKVRGSRERLPVRQLTAKRVQLLLHEVECIGPKQEMQRWLC